jgi:hypothetical protein
LVLGFLIFSFLLLLLSRAHWQWVFLFKDFLLLKKCSLSGNHL